MSMNIGELSRQTGVSIRSLRYYEVKQLLSPQRGENKYRSYDTTAIDQVKAIQFYLGLGLTTDQIFDLVKDCDVDEVLCELDEASLSSCPSELELYKEKLVQIEEQIASLEEARTFIRRRLAKAQEQKNAEDTHTDTNREEILIRSL